MRTTSNYLFDVVAIQHLYIHHGLHLEQELVACAFGGITGASLLSTQYSKADPNVAQYFAYIARNALGTFVKTACTSHPK